MATLSSSSVDGVGINGWRRFSSSSSSSSPRPSSSRDDGVEAVGKAITARRSKGFFEFIAEQIDNIIFMFKSGFALNSDDHTDPWKILERKMSYLCLLLMHFRMLRLIYQDDREVYTPHPSEYSKESIEARIRLWDQAGDELEADFNPDRESNRGLRNEMQKYLFPIVMEVLESFHDVDTTTAISMQLNNPSTNLESFQNDNEEEFYRTTLLQERQFTIDAMNKLWQDHKTGVDHLPSMRISRMKSRVVFYHTKFDAVQRLIRFHGWDVDDATGFYLPSPPENLQLLQPDMSLLKGLDEFGMDTRGLSKSTLRNIRFFQTINLCRSAKIRDRLGYSLIALRSSLPGAGRGVYVDGSVLAGSLVGFRPGDVWPREYAMESPNEVLGHLFTNDPDDLVFRRFDFNFIDSRKSPVTVLCREGSMNPWALGHMINHPNPSGQPNCYPTILNFTTDMRLEQNGMLHYIPNRYVFPPGQMAQVMDRHEVVMHSLCYISSIDLVDEEVLYDYRLERKLRYADGLPSYYNVVNYGHKYWDDDFDGIIGGEFEETNKVEDGGEVSKEGVKGST